MSEVTLIDAPVVPGLRFRMFAGEADLAPNVALNNICSRADGLSWVDTVTAAKQWLTNMDDMCNPYRDMLFGEVNGQMIARGITGWFLTEEGEWTCWLDCVVHPDWRGKGMGRAILSWQEQHGRELAAAQNNANASKFFQSWVVSSMPTAIALLQATGYEATRFGYTLNRSLDLAIAPIPEIALPAGFEIRPTQPEHYRAVFDADKDAFQDQTGHREQSEEVYQEWLTDKQFQPENFRVAWNIEKNEIAGVVLNYVNSEQNKVLGRKRGYTQSVSVRHPYRKLGIAKALIAMSLHLHKSLAMTEVALGVDVPSLDSSLQLYESMGYVKERQATTFRKAISD